MSSIIFGRKGENAAREFLHKKGYRILTENYQIRGGELDLVALYKKTLVFAEVTSRSGVSYGNPAEAVGEKKIRLLRNAGETFIRQQCRNGRVPVYMFGIKFYKKYNNTRNDIVEIYMSKSFKIESINHIENAF